MAKQVWIRPEVYEPGEWSQMPVKYLKPAARGDVPALRELLRERPDFLDSLSSHNRTLLWEATRAGRLEAVRFLVERGARVNTPGCYNSESHVLITPYCAASYYKRDELADYLWSVGSKLDVFRAAFLGDERRVARRLNAQPKMLNAEDPFDRIYFTPLIAFAVAGEHVALTEELIDRGADVVRYCQQLLFLAALRGRIDLAKLLLERGADPSALDANIIGVMRDLEVLELLLQHGASATRAGYGGYPPIVHAARGDKGGRPDRIELLLKHGAKVNASTPRGRTALHYAAASGFRDIVAMLLEHGADAALRDEEGKTAADLARKSNKNEVARLLKAAS